MPAQMSLVFKKQKWLHFQTWGSKLSSCSPGSRFSAARSTDSDVGTYSVLWSQLPDSSELLWSPSVIVPFSSVLKIFLGIAQPEAYGLEGGKKREEKKQELANFFLTLIRRKVQVVSVYTNQNNKARNWRGNGFALSAHYLMPIDKEMLRKLEVHVAVTWWGDWSQYGHCYSFKVKVSWVGGFLKAQIIGHIVSVENYAGHSLGRMLSWGGQISVLILFTTVFKIKTKCQ